MKQMQSFEELEYESAKAQRELEQKKPSAAPERAPRPRWQRVTAWVLIGILVLGVLGMCYWQMFSIF